jgi:2-oxoglutarate dehydrogenase E2 component (dihydrolipoamide succinyltransferase)
MATAIQMPKLGHTMSEGKVIHWHKQPGEPVREGEAILTIETDKTEVEVESPVAGVMGAHWPYPTEVMQLEVSTCRKEGRYEAGTIQ